MKRSSASNRRIPIRKHPRRIVAPDPHMEVPQLELVALLELLPHHRRRLGFAWMCAIGHDVLDASELVIALLRAAIQDDLRPLELDLRVGERRVPMVKAHRAMLRMLNAVRNVANVSNRNG